MLKNAYSNTNEIDLIDSSDDFVDVLEPHGRAIFLKIW